MFGYTKLVQASAAVVSAVTFLAFPQFSMAADLEWNGLYRFEANHIEKSELSGEATKDYGLHHLILRPKIVAADGLFITGRLDLFNSAQGGNTAN